MSYQNPYFQQYPQMPYQSQITQPMDRLAQLQAQQCQSVPQANQGLLWVQGEAGAKSYLVAPNTTVLLMDSEGSRFYLKSTDGAGMPSLRTFEYKEVLQDASQAQQSAQINLDDKYVTRNEYEALQARYEEMADKLNNFPVPDVTGGAARRTETRSNSSKNKGGSIDE